MRYRILLLSSIIAMGCGSNGGAGNGTQGNPPGPVPASDDFCSDGWCWVSPKPHGNDLLGGWVDDTGTLWVVGAGPTLATWDGASWTPRQAPGTEGLTSIWGTSTTDLWVGSAGSVWHWNGRDWREHSVGESSLKRPVVSIYGTGTDAVWAADGEDRLVRWDGNAWKRVGEAPPGVFLHAVWASGPGDVWAVGGAGYGKPGVLLHGDGASLPPVQTPANGDLLAVSGAAANDVWVGGADGAVFHWDGQSWQDRSLPNGTVADLLVIGPSDVWCTVDNMLPRHWDGSSWTAIEAAPVSFGATRTDGATIWTLGESGEVQERTAAGWKSLTTRVTDVSLNGVWVDPLGQAWIVGEKNTALMANDKDVQLVDAPAGTRLFGVHGTSNLDVWAVWAAGVFRYSGSGFQAVDLGTSLKDLSAIWASAGATWVGGKTELGVWDGTTWTDRATALDILGLWGSAPDDVWAVGRYGAVEHHHGSSYDPYSVGSTGQEGLDIGGSGPSDIWVVNAHGGVFRGAGPLTEVAAPGIRINAVWVAAPNEAYVAGEGLARWDGSQWNIAVGIQPNLSDISGAAGQQWAVGPHGTILQRQP